MSWVVVPAQVAVNLDPGSDSGLPNYPGITNITDPTFDVQVNQAGTIEMDFQGNGTINATLSVPVAGTYQFTSPTLANGTYTATATFESATGGTSTSSTTYTINTLGPYVTTMSPEWHGRHQRVRGSGHLRRAGEPEHVHPLGNHADWPEWRPSPSISHELVSGSTYDIAFATQTAQGAYTLTIGTSVTDYAGNEMDQDQNGINGQPDDSFTGTFTIGLPDLAVTATQAPSSALLGARIPVSWTVTNLSPTNPAPSTWTDAVYISPDSVLDGSAVPLITVDEPPQSPLAPGASYTSNTSVTIPGNVPIGSDVPPLRDQCQWRTARIQRAPMTLSPCRSRWLRRTCR